MIEATNAGEHAAARSASSSGCCRARAARRVSPIKVDGRRAAAFQAGADRRSASRSIIARSDDRVVVGVGEAAAADGARAGREARRLRALRAGQGRARRRLRAGASCSRCPTLIEAVEATGEADADFAKAKPYLEAFSVIASGGTFEDDELQLARRRPG